MKRISALIIVCFLLINCTTKNSSTQRVNKTEQDSLLNLVYVDGIDYTKKTQLLDSLYAINKSNTNKKEQIRVLHNIGNRYYYLNNLDGFKKVSEECLALATQSSDTLHMAKCSLNLGEYYGKKSKQDSAFYYCNKAEKLFSKTKDFENLGKSKLTKGFLYLDVKNYNLSEEYFVEALKIAKKIKIPDYTYICYDALGRSLTESKNYTNALVYYEKAQQQIDSIDKNLEYYKKIFTVQTLNNIGDVYFKERKYALALENYNKAFEIKDLIKLNPTLFASLLENKAFCEMKMGQRKNVLQNLEKALQLNDSLQYTVGTIKSTIRISDYYKTEKKYALALQKSKKAFQLAVANNNLDYELKALMQIAELDTLHKGTHYQNYIKLNDSVNEIERNTREQFARIELETDEIENQRKILEIENKAQSKFFILFSIGVFILFLAMLFAIYSFSLLAKNRKLLLKQMTQEKEEEIFQFKLKESEILNQGKAIEKKRISEDLHDSIMGRLSSIRMNLYILNHNTEPETIQKCIAHIAEIKEVEKEIRSITHNLNYFNEQEANSSFEIMVENLLENHKKQTNQTTKLSMEDTIEWKNIDVKIKVNIYRIIQEALLNIQKYAKATKTTVILKREANTILLKISDNGIGFDEKTIKKGIGIKNFYSRANELQAKLEIKSKKGDKTTIFMQIPI